MGGYFSSPNVVYTSEMVSQSYSYAGEEGISPYVYVDNKICVELLNS